MQRESPAYTIRPVEAGDHDALWRILRPIIRAGETYTLPIDLSRDDALAYWLSPKHATFVAQDESGEILGSYYLRANQQGGGAHVANCGYMTLTSANGRGVARAMCSHSLEQARQHGFLAVQFNFVVSTNERAIALWKSMGFEVVGVLPNAFRHPSAGLVDALVMYRHL